MQVTPCIIVSQLLFLPPTHTFTNKWQLAWFKEADRDFKTLSGLLLATTFSSSLDCTALLTLHDHLIHFVHALIGNIRTSISSNLHHLYRKDGRLYRTDSQLNGSSTMKHVDNIILLQSNGLYDGARRRPRSSQYGIDGDVWLGGRLSVCWCLSRKDGVLNSQSRWAAFPVYSTLERWNTTTKLTHHMMMTRMTQWLHHT